LRKQPFVIYESRQQVYMEEGGVNYKTSRVRGSFCLIASPRRIAEPQAKQSLFPLK